MSRKRLHHGRRSFLRAVFHPAGSYWSGYKGESEGGTKGTRRGRRKIAAYAALGSGVRDIALGATGGIGIKESARLNRWFPKLRNVSKGKMMAIGMGVGVVNGVAHGYPESIAGSHVKAAERYLRSPLGRKWVKRLRRPEEKQHRRYAALAGGAVGAVSGHFFREVMPKFARRVPWRTTTGLYGAYAGYQMMKAHQTKQLYRRRSKVK